MSNNKQICGECRLLIKLQIFDSHYTLDSEIAEINKKKITVTSFFVLFTWKNVLKELNEWLLNHQRLPSTFMLLFTSVWKWNKWIEMNEKWGWQAKRWSRTKVSVIWFNMMIVEHFPLLLCWIEKSGIVLFLEINNSHIYFS